MNIEVLKAMIDKWNRVSSRDENEVRSGDPEAAIDSAHGDGINYGIKKCVEDLELLIKVIG